MQQSGSSLLHLIQNDEMVPLDLLVRESVQNSLDASINTMEPVRVSFRLISHVTDAVASLLPEIAEGLKRKYSGTRLMLQIRDTGTQGLTGPVSLGGDAHGNLVKLVYEISQPQEKKNAGGSWGLGKTVYYRMGAGIVFYYSRIRKGNGFEERLAACFVENEKSPDKVMTSSKTGIAWWGGENIYADDALWASALTDPSEIGSVLLRLGADPYVDEETGTSVIIPFLRHDLLPRQAFTEDDDEADLPANALVSSPWYGGFAGYLKYSLLRWYAVRISNESYPLFAYGSKLEAVVDGEDVSEIMPPLFRVLQALFNRVYEEESDPQTLPEEIFCKPVMLRGNTFDGDQCAGWISAVRLTREQLGMGSPDNEHSPFAYLMNRGDDTVCLPVIGYLRSPGMIVSWNDEKWKKVLKGGKSGEYVIGLFVPYSSQAFTQQMAASTGCETLEEYLRSTEKADHSVWADRSGQSIIRRISTNVQNKINDHFFPVENVPADVKTNLDVSRRLARAFLPAGFGRDSRFVPESGRGGDPPFPFVFPGTNPVFRVQDFSYLPGKIIMSWTLFWGKKKCQAHRLSLDVATINLPISADIWGKDSELGEFPFAFDFMTASFLTRGKEKTVIALHLVPGEKGADAEKLIDVTVSETAIDMVNISGNSMDAWSFGGTLAIRVKKKDEDLVPVILLQADSGQGGVQ